MSVIAPGAEIAGRYVLESVLGQGGSGVVFRALDRRDHDHVVLKILRPDVADDPVLIQRFAREARLAAKLKSPHTARVLDVGALPDGAPFIVMELLHGADLSRVAGTQGPLPCGLVAQFGIEACEGLDEAHRAGILHRDLKLSNLFLASTPDGRQIVKLLDFGTAKTFAPEAGKVETSLTRGKRPPGTVHYASPEHWRGAAMDPRSDIWSLGVCLYILITGTRPFDGSAAEAVVARVLAVAPAQITSLRPETPAGLASAIHQCLEKDPAKRPADVRALAAGLAPFAVRGVVDLRAAGVADEGPDATTQEIPGKARRR